MVSSTLGSSTSTGWNRRSSAGSFSMYFRYSSMVVAPMARSSPFASAGFSMFAASTEPCAAPAPTSVWSSSMKRMISPFDSSTSFRRAFSRSSNCPRKLVPATSEPMSSATIRLRLQGLGDVPVHDPVGDPLGDGRLADARLADQHRVVLGPPRQDLQHAADLLVPADHRVQSSPVGRGRSGPGRTAPGPGTCPPESGRSPAGCRGSP